MNLKYRFLLLIVTRWCIFKSTCWRDSHFPFVTNKILKEINQTIGSEVFLYGFAYPPDLSVDKGVTVDVMASRGWGVGGGAWVWRRRLFAWEEECVRECCALLHDIVL